MFFYVVIKSGFGLYDCCLGFDPERLVVLWGTDVKVLLDAVEKVERGCCWWSRELSEQFRGDGAYDKVKRSTLVFAELL